LPEPAPVLLLHDAAGEGQPHPPAAWLARDPRLEQLPSDARGNPWPIVPHRESPGAAGGLDQHVHLAAATAQRIYSVLHQRFERPLEQHGVAAHNRPRAGRAQGEGDGAGQGRQARLEVGDHPLGHGTETNRLLP
jgi:hypothetical protein